jgi:phosphomevalonate kinase
MLAIMSTTPQPRVLCISGKRFAGKDTLARHLVAAATARGHTLESYAFAGESKRMFAAGDPAVDLGRLLSDREYKEALRPRLTQFTVDALAADPLVFCREVMRRIDASGSHALITDLRLRLEVDHLRSRGTFHVIRIQRPDALRASSGWTYDAAKDGHRTETELDDPTLWDVVIENDRDEAALAVAADALISRWL